MIRHRLLKCNDLRGYPIKKHEENYVGVIKFVIGLHLLPLTPWEYSPIRIVERAQLNHDEMPTVLMRLFHGPYLISPIHNQSQAR